MYIIYFQGKNKWYWIAGAVVVGLLVVSLTYILGYSFGSLMAKFYK